MIGLIFVVPTYFILLFGGNQCNKSKGMLDVPDTHILSFYFSSSYAEDILNASSKNIYKQKKLNVICRGLSFALKIGLSSYKLLKD